MTKYFFEGFKYWEHRAERRSLFMVNWFLLSRLAKVPWGLSVCLGWACFDTDSDTATSKKFLCADLLWLVLKYDQSEAMCQIDTDTMRQTLFWSRIWTNHCRNFWNWLWLRTTDTQGGLFSKIQNFCASADILCWNFLRPLGYFGQTISTPWVQGIIRNNVSPLSMCSIIQPLFLQKTKPIQTKS